ncbi:hypothetical protein E2C06_17645 [Dankookia rubra]|uniref:DUF4185 domain-containing protein n=1 Tax=Dankookia rubra TaxID=1442381 RepID=A0A4R5QFT7_9PROT|nr:hypothetical protein [Dankookia rubra]TDH61327.1 hypothetical protein E2C06_17645 [Dankookia rubra]
MPEGRSTVALAPRGKPPRPGPVALRLGALGRAALGLCRRAAGAPRLGWLAAGLVMALGAPAAAQPVGLTPAGGPRTLYRWATDRCEDEFIPDAPARAFRRADGRMALLATHRENWMLLGDDFATLRPDCRSVLRSSAQGSGELWIEATYTRDGREVVALVSQDLSLRVRAAGCDRRDLPGRCWLNNILAARSADMGQSFALVPGPSGMVATLGDHYPAEARSRHGVFTTSNIVRHAGAYYMVAYLQAEARQPPGNCLFRTEDPFVPASWRGWDGRDFALDLSGPGGGRPCVALAPQVLQSEVRSLTYVPGRGVWLAVFRGRLRLEGDAAPVPGFYYAQSRDLLAWEAPRRLWAAPTEARRDDATRVTNYPSLLDPASASRNFETLDSGRPVLLFTVQHLRQGQGSMDRDLQYLPLRMD